MDIVLFLSLTILGLIIGYHTVIALIHKKFNKEIVELKSEIANLKEEKQQLEDFQEEILDVEEKIFDAWLEAVVKARQQRSSHDQL